jgi:hypothetical protein
MSGKDFIKNAVKICKDMLLGDGKHLKVGKNAEQPIVNCEELSTGNGCDASAGPELAGQYQQLIGILRWAVELGRVDILLDVSLMSSHLCQPRMGHLEAVYNIFAYLDKHVEATMAFDDRQPNIVEDAFTHTG